MRSWPAIRSSTSWRWRARLGIFGSIDMNRNDYQSGWDTDQFPNNVPEMALAYYEVLQGGRVHHRRHQFRRQAAAPVAGSRRSDPGPCRRHGCLRARSEGGGGDAGGRQAGGGARRALCRLETAPRRRRCWRSDTGWTIWRAMCVTAGAGPRATVRPAGAAGELGQPVRCSLEDCRPVPARLAPADPPPWPPEHAAVCRPVASCSWRGDLHGSGTKRAPLRGAICSVTANKCCVRPFPNQRAPGR